MGPLNEEVRLELEALVRRAVREEIGAGRRVAELEARIAYLEARLAQPFWPPFHPMRLDETGGHSSAAVPPWVEGEPQQQPVDS